MLTKVAGLARAVAVILAIVAGFVAIPTNVALILVLLGVLAGFAYGEDGTKLLVVTALALGFAGAAAGNIPEVGDKVAAALTNVGLAVGGALLTRVVLRLYDVVVGDLKGLGAK